MMRIEIDGHDASHRRYWVASIRRLSGDFGNDASRVSEEVSAEIKNQGTGSLLRHLRHCGVIPESFGHDSSEEKLYSKYTDVVIHEAFSAIGLSSVVLKERSGVADVECVCDEYSFVADAKAFRLSRTAKNQKDFKVQAMVSWKHGKPFATVVCPIYQLPSRASQIYSQAASGSVYLCTYTHLSVLVRFAHLRSRRAARNLLHEQFKIVEAMNPSKDSVSYWQAINRSMLNADRGIPTIWREEKLALGESIVMAKKEALRFYANERKRIMRLSRRQAIAEVLRNSKVESRVRAVQSVTDNGLLGVS